MKMELKQYVIKTTTHSTETHIVNAVSVEQAIKLHDEGKSVCLEAQEYEREIDEVMTKDQYDEYQAALNGGEA